MANNKHFTVEEQIDTMKKYVTFTNGQKCVIFCSILGISVLADMGSIYYHIPMCF